MEKERTHSKEGAVGGVEYLPLLEAVSPKSNKRTPFKTKSKPLSVNKVWRKSWNTTARYRLIVPDFPRNDKNDPEKITDNYRYFRGCFLRTRKKTYEQGC